MNDQFELHTWRMAASYCGQFCEQETCEEYVFRDRGVVARVYLVPPSWIRRNSLPKKFLYEASNNVVGCVKTSYFNEDGHMVPCLVYDMEQERTTWDNYEESMDPVLFIIQEHLRYEDNTQGLVVIQSALNPWHVGAVLHCDPSEIKPLPWSEDDHSMIYGIDETDAQE